MFIAELFESSDSKDLTLVDALSDFLPIAIKHLGLESLPKIHLLKDMEHEETHVPTFGEFINDTNEINLAINGRHPVDIIRTLAHEMTHFKQNCLGELRPDSGETGSDEENEANSEAGIMLREFDTRFPQYLTMDPVICP